MTTTPTEAIARLREMHKPRTERRDSGCVQCGILWPCPTRLIVDQVVPGPTREDTLREAAEIADGMRQFEPAYGARKSAQVSENVGALRVAEGLRRIAEGRDS